MAPCRGIIDEYVADVEVAKSASMSRQRRWRRLAPSDDVAGTWKRFSATSTSATWGWGWCGVIGAVGLAVWWCHSRVVRWEVGV